MKCPNCEERESLGLIPLFQKDGNVIYEQDLCGKCTEELIEDWAN
jgi:hypothetical protein